MKVVFKIPVTGKLRASFDTPVELNNWSFALTTEYIGEFVSFLIVEVCAIEKEYWPTLVPIESFPIKEIPQFPFQVNEKVFGFSHFEKNIIKLEGFLSLFGLEEMRLEDVSTEWVIEEGDVVESGLMVDLREKKQKMPLATRAMTRNEFEVCLIASQGSEKQSATLSHYRSGLVHFRARRYLDAIRNLYLAFENEFELTSGKQETLRRLSRNDFYRNSLSNFLNKKDRSMAAISSKYNIDFQNVDPIEIGRLLFKLRGSLQHSNLQSMKCWHPSKQSDFENEAVCLLNLMDQICWDIVQSRMESVQNAGATAKLD